MDFFDVFVLVMLALFYIVFIGRSVALNSKGIRILVLGKGKKGMRRFVEVFLSVGLLYWTAEAVNAAAGLRLPLLPQSFGDPMFQSPVLKAIGCILILGGLITFFLSLVSFGSSWRIGIDSQKPGQLVTTGVFSFTRNPIFLFIDMLFFSVWLIYGTLFFLATAVLVILVIHYQILQEERFLEGFYGEAYIAYKKNVRRYI